MRFIGYFFCFLLLAACAPVQLRERSTHYSFTFADLEDRIILENLARFIDDQDRLPSMADFKQGAVQATDNVSLGATIPFSKGLSGTNVVKNPAVFNVGAVQTQSQDNWTYVPVTDVEDLTRARCLYKYAILQSRHPDRYRTKRDWTAYSKEECAIGGHAAVIGYTPPFEPWLIWRPFSEIGSLPDSFTDDWGRPVIFLGTYRSYGLWGVPKSFHDFQLAVLGSIPNTAGSSAAGTSPAATRPVIDTGQLLLSGALQDGLKNFKGPGETIKIAFTIVNTTQKPLKDVQLVSTRFKRTEGQCTIPSTLPPNFPSTCVAETTTTPQDTVVEDLTTVYGTDANNNVLSSAVHTIVPKEGAKFSAQVIRKVQPSGGLIVAPNATKGFQPIFPMFVPGKSSGQIAPPLAAPAQ